MQIWGAKLRGGKVVDVSLLQRRFPYLHERIAIYTIYRGYYIEILAY